MKLRRAVEVKRKVQVSEPPVVGQATTMLNRIAKADYRKNKLIHVVTNTFNM